MGLLDIGGSSTCPARPASADIKGESIAGSLTFQKIMLIGGWICVAVTLCLWFGLLLPHLRRYNSPNEQRQILRIILTPVIFAITAILSIHFYGAADYLAPLASLYEAFALASLFLLYINYVTPESAIRDEYFHNLENKSKKGIVSPGGSLRWFRRTWRTVFIYCLVYTILVIIQEATQATGVYCDTSLKPKFAHIWIQVLQLIFTIWAVTAVVRFYRRLKIEMAGHKAFGKLVSFKIIVFVSTIQRFVFSLLQSKVTGNSKVTFSDITVGLPAFLFCIEGVFFTVGFYFTFRSGEYRTNKEDTRVPYGMGRAMIDAMNPMDLLHGIVTSLTYIGRRRSK